MDTRSKRVTDFSINDVLKSVDADSDSNARSGLSRGLFSQQDFNNQDSQTSYYGGGGPSLSGGSSSQGPVSLNGGGIHTDGKRGYTSDGQRIRGVIGLDGKWAPRTNLDGSISNSQWGI